MKRISKSKALKLYKEIKDIEKRQAPFKQLDHYLKTTVQKLKDVYYGRVVEPHVSTAIANIIINTESLREQIEEDVAYLENQKFDVEEELRDNNYPITGDIIEPEDLVRFTK